MDVDEVDVQGLLEQVQLLGLEFIFGLALMLSLVLVLVWAILRATTAPGQAQGLVIVLGVLALVSALGYLVGGDERAELITLGATAVGALAGALTMMVSSEDRKKPPEVEKEEEDGESESSGEG